MRRNNFRVSRKMILQKAREMFGEVEDANSSVFKASREWLEDFLNRSGLGVSRRTTVTQKSSHDVRENGVVYSFYGEDTRQNQSPAIRHLRHGQDSGLVRYVKRDDST